MANTGPAEPQDLEDEDDPVGIPPIDLTGPDPVPVDQDEQREIEPQPELATPGAAFEEESEPA